MHERQNTKEKGQLAENIAAGFLEGQGLRIRARNVKASGSEVDIVALVPNDELRFPPLYIFVEVRSRAAQAQGHPLETVNRKKQRQIIRTATSWLVAQNLWEQVAVRFDVVGIVVGARQMPQTTMELRPRSIPTLVSNFDEGSELGSDQDHYYVSDDLNTELIWIKDAFSLS